MAFIYALPGEIASYGGTAATSAGTTETGYTDDWVADGRFGRPARATTGTVTWALTFASAEVGLVVLGSCNSDVNCTVSGGLSGTITAGALQGDGTRFNPFQLFTPATITTFSVGFSGAAAVVILGEAIGAKYRELTRGFRVIDSNVGIASSREKPRVPSVNNYDRGFSPVRTISGSALVTGTEKDVLAGWVAGERERSRPGVIIPRSTVNDAWVVWQTAFDYGQSGPDLYEVRMTFEELPRKRWP